MPSITESDSLYEGLENRTVRQLLTSINEEDKKVAEAVHVCIPQIELLVEAVIGKLSVGGRLFYLGAGTSGRLGIVDASELPPTYGLPFDVVIGLIAGGDSAIRRAVEFAEDSEEEGWHDLQKHQVSDNDIVIGIAASGRTPYVVGALKQCRARQILTGCITCNPDAAVIQYSDFPVVAIVGPEFVTGSTRMKAGTVQKLILNMISTTAMIRLGHVRDNKMVDMQLTNHKLIDRGTRMIMDKSDLSYDDAKRLLITHGSVRKALEFLKKI